LKNYFQVRLAQQCSVQPDAPAIMIHLPDNADSIIARLASRLEFFNSHSQKGTNA
jgi:hypothetical protein